MKQYLHLAAFISPFILFFLIGSVIPYERPVDEEIGVQLDSTDDAAAESVAIDPDRFLAVVIARVALMGIALALFWRIYLKSFPFAIDRWGILVGLIGGVLWIAVCNLGIEATLLGWLGLPENSLGERSSVNPLELYADGGQRNLFLIFRFALLVITVPIAEELFLRGFFMRFADSVDWENLPLTEIGTTGLVAGTAYGVLSHPSEFVAAALWFSLVTLLMVKTGKFWNCVAAHAITNLMLGIYVMQSGSWHLW